MSALRFEQSLAQEIPFVRLSMLEESDDVLFIGIREQEVFRLLTGILVCSPLSKLEINRECLRVGRKQFEAGVLVSGAKQADPRWCQADVVETKREKVRRPLKRNVHVLDD